MAQIKEKSTGFLDGYMAANLAENTGVLKAHEDQIANLLKDAKIKLEEHGSKQEISKEIDNFLSKTPEKEYTKYSVEFSDLISKINHVGTKDLPTETNYLIRRSIFHFLNLAKTLQDEKVIDLAMKVANSYNKQPETV